MGEFQRKASAGQEFDLTETFGSLDALGSCGRLDAQSFEDESKCL